MSIPEKYLDELTSRCDIVDIVSQYVHLTKRTGANLFGCCPFHSEKTPSFSVRPDRQTYHCFGCGKGGGVIRFIMEIENLSFRDAVAFLAEKVHMPPPEDDNPQETSLRQRILELNRDAARFFHARLMEDAGRPAQEYVLRRKISPAMVTRFGLGFAPDSWDALSRAMEAKGYTDQELFRAGLVKKGSHGFYDVFRNRLIFPIIDVRGSVIGFSGRFLGEDPRAPKYLNSPETPVYNKSNSIFGLNLAKKSKCGYILLVEGNIDVVALHQAGFDGAAASLGTSLTSEQARLISRYTKDVVICYDSDAAGKKATQRAIGILDKLDVKVRVLTLPGAKDPDEYIGKNGADAFRRLIEGSAGQVAYRLSLVEGQHDLGSDEGRLAYLQEAGKLLAALPMPAQRELYAAQVAEKAGVRLDSVLQEIEVLRKKNYRQARRSELRENSRPLKAVQPKKREFHYDDPVSAMAEEGLIRLLYLDPGLSRRGDLLREEDFSSPLLGRFYGELLRRIRDNASLSLEVLSGEFSPDEMDLFTSILNGEEDLSNGEKAMTDYINVITGQRDRNSADLLQLSENLRQTKGYGGTKT